MKTQYLFPDKIRMLAYAPGGSLFRCAVLIPSQLTPPKLRR